MRGKDKCRILKQIRQQIADANDIEYITRECTYQGDCRGTCPKCEAELRYLEEQLELRRNRGKKAVVAAVAAGIIMTTATGCDFSMNYGKEPGGAPPAADRIEKEVVEGEMPYVEEELMGAPPAREEEEVEAGEVAEEELIEELEGDVAYIDPSEEEVEIEGDVAYIEPEDNEMTGAEAEPTNAENDGEAFITPDEMAEYYAEKADGAAE
ncbi:MAG: hypothetical protein IKK29_05820 [Christensenellaceae bacterium]|nr:hypothetical protein [Christensenellaceae bacterium]